MHFFRSRLSALITLFCVSVAVALPQLTTAAVSLIPECALTDGSCSTCDFVGFFANLSEFFLQFLAVGVLLMIVIGGLMWILSAGRDDLVAKGKATLVGAVMGTLIALGGYFIINGVIGVFVGDSDFSDVSLFGTEWNEYCEAPARSSTTTTTDDDSTSVSDCTGVMDGAECSCESGDCSCVDEMCVSSSDVTTYVDDCTDVTDGAECITSDCATDDCVCSDEICTSAGVSTGDSSCSGKSDGDACSSESCGNEEKCRCYGAVCVSLCEYTSDNPAGCVSSASDCTDTLGTATDETGELCPLSSEPICCESAE